VGESLSMHTNVICRYGFSGSYSNMHLCDTHKPVSPGDVAASAAGR